MRRKCFDLPVLSAAMKYLHTMVRVRDLDASLRFYCGALGLRELRRTENEKGRFTLIFLAAPGDDDAQVELTFNWDPEDYQIGRAFGHLAYEVEDVYAACQRLRDHGVTINRPPRDGRMAFASSEARTGGATLGARARPARCGGGIPVAAA